MKIPLTALLCGIVMASAALAQPERQALPDFGVIDLEGISHPVAELEGVVTLLNFWATWCGPCRTELPELQKLYNELGGKGLAVLAINVEGVGTPVQQFMDMMHLTLPAYFISRQDNQRLGIRGIPFSVLVDRQGRVVRVYQGYSPDSVKNMRELAEKLIEESEAGRKGE